MGWVVPVLGALSSVVGIGSSLGLFGGKDEEEVAQLPSLPAEPSPDKAAELARQQEEDKRRKAYSRKNTILTMPGLEEADTEKKTLLGG